MTFASDHADVEFSVIVPTCRRPETLARALACLGPGTQTYSSASYEVIVTDDDPALGASAALSRDFPWVRWTSGPGRGPAANRNHGARQARGRWLAFTDDDCLPDRAWLSAFFHAREENPSVRVLEGRTIADRPRRTLLETAPINETGGHLWSCNFAIENALFRELGGFDERFVWATMEDADLAERLRERHLPFSFVPRATVCHPWRSVDARRTHERHLPSLLLFLQLHPQHLPEHRPAVYGRNIVKGMFRHVLPALVHGRWAELANCWQGTVATLRVMWGVHRLQYSPPPSAPGPQPWPALE
jgi:GT2 family glycosyltransferase